MTAAGGLAWLVVQTVLQAITKSADVSPSIVHLHYTDLHLDLLSAFQTCRQQTLALIADIDDEVLRTQAHPDFSPVGWHLGHIAFTESFWITEYLAKQLPLFSQYEQLFSADGLPKAERQNLPKLAEILEYLAKVRSHTLSYLQQHPPNQHPPSEHPPSEQSRLWHWLLQHESQHAETIAMVLAMHQQQGKKTPSHLPTVRQLAAVSTSATDAMTCIEAGPFSQGYDAPQAIDNERPQHEVVLQQYWISQTPVTIGQYRQFIDLGGYENPKWWSPQGWQWQQHAQVSKPLYWTTNPTFDNRPVCGVNWYEADAYARAIGKRLPTEAEWAKAASMTSFEAMHSGVWEWTDTWFSGYSGFTPFPYAGYSQTYFDGAHRVLKGSSWATPHWVKRKIGRAHV